MKDEKNFTQIPNIIFEYDLSGNAFKTYCWLLSKSTIPNWKIIKEVVQKGTKIGRDAFHTAWTELKEKGFLHHNGFKTANGKFVDLKSPQGKFTHSYTFNKYPAGYGKSGCPELVPVNPNAVNPVTACPVMENPYAINTYLNNNEIESKVDLRILEPEFNMKFHDNDLPNSLKEIESSQIYFDKGSRELKENATESETPLSSKIVIESNRVNVDVKEKVVVQKNPAPSEAPLSSNIKFESNRIPLNLNKNDIQMLTIISLKNRDLIYKEFSAFDQFQNLPNKDHWFDKWYNYKSGQDSLDKTFTLKQYWAGFSAYTKRGIDYGYNPIPIPSMTISEKVIERKKTLDEIKAERDRVENITEKIQLEVYNNLTTHWDEHNRNHMDLVHYIRAYNKDLTNAQLNDPVKVIENLTRSLMIASWNEVMSYLTAKGFEIRTGAIYKKP